MRILDVDVLQDDFSTIKRSYFCDVKTQLLVAWLYCFMYMLSIICYQKKLLS